MPKKGTKKGTRNKVRVSLSNGCQYTQPYISPANWNNSTASVKKPWKLRFTFYDPIRRPEGKAINWQGMNCFETLPERQAATRQLLTDTLNDLEKGYNPVTKKFEPLPTGQNSNIFSGPEQVVIEQYINNPGEIVTVETPLNDALHWAESRAAWTHRTRLDIQSYMTSIFPAIRVLGYDKLELGKITFQHIDNILAQTFKSNSKYNPKKKKEVKITWSNFKKNRAKNYFSCYFGVLKEKKVIKDNPCSGMKDLPWKKKKEDVYSPAELQDIFRLLRSNDPDFALFMMLFFDSGARETEFMKLRKPDIDLDKQTFKREILKGLHKKDNDEADPEGIISDAALPYWRKALENCKDGDYIFSRGFRPGPKPIGPDVINRRWRKIVKPHFPKSRPYLMKHTNLTNIVDQFGDSNIAAFSAGHTSDEMIRKVYDKRKNQRAHALLRTKSNLNLLSAPELLSSGLPATANCAALAVIGALLPPLPPRLPCQPCLMTTIIPAKPFTSMLAA